MKKSLLLAAAVLCAGSLMAKDYTVFSNSNYADLEWEGGNDGFTTTLTVDGVKFTLALEKNKSTSNCIKPGDQIRIYKNASFTVTAEGMTMKSVEMTGMSGYAGLQTYSDGWTATEDGVVVTALNAAGASTFTSTSTANQFRLVNLVVRDDASAVDPVTPEATVVKSVAETIAQAKGTTVKVDYPLTVAFVSNSNVFCCDEAGDFIQLYGANTYAPNDVVPAGWEGVYTLYGTATPELTPGAGGFPASTSTTEFVAKKVAGSDISVDLVNSVVTIPNVVFADATPDTKTNFTGEADGTELSFRNNYTIEGVEAGTYDVTVVVTIYQNAPSLYVIKYAEASSTGVEAVEVAEAAAAYYNLQGVKVANPANGVFVRVQNGKAVKVML